MTSCHLYLWVIRQGNKIDNVIKESNQLNLLELRNLQFAFGAIDLRLINTTIWTLKFGFSHLVYELDKSFAKEPVNLKFKPLYLFKL